MSLLKKSIVFETTFSRFTAVERIGEGGAGIVYRAQDASGADVAVKVLDPSKARSADRRQRFKNELLFGMRNQHKNIITVIDHGLHVLTGGEFTPFYVMPFYPRSLRQLIAEGIAHSDVLPLFAQCLDGVEAAHLVGVVHRDIKPENILYDPKQKRPVVADFGIAEFTQDELYTLVETKPDTRLANFLYAAPEQRQRGGLPCDRRTDVFALGLILSEMFTRVVPHGTGYPTIATSAPEFAYLDELVSRMIRQNITERPETIEVVKNELIGRKNAFVEQQQLNAVKQTVIPTSALADPLIDDPIRVVDVDWENSVLKLKLNRTVNADWVQALQFGPYSRNSLMSAPPERFQFHGDTASVPANSRDAQQVIDHFNGWLPHANRIYAERRKSEKAKEEQRKREALEREIKAREEQAAVKSRLRF